MFDLQVTRMLPTKFQVNWPFGSREEAKKIFSRWPPRQPSWISDRNDFCFFFFFFFFGRLGFPIGTILAIFDLPITPMLPTKFQVSLPFGSGEKQINDFQDGGYGGHLFSRNM